MATATQMHDGICKYEEKTSSMIRGVLDGIRSNCFQFSVCQMMLKWSSSVHSTSVNY